MSQATQMNESCYADELVMQAWMRVMSHTHTLICVTQINATQKNEWYDIDEWVMPHNERVMVQIRWIRVMSHRQIHVSQMSESCHIDKSVMCHRSKGHISQMNASCHTDEWVMSHRSISHVTQINDSCHRDKRVKPHRSMSRVLQINTSCHTNKWVISSRWISDVSYIMWYYSHSSVSDP